MEDHTPSHTLDEAMSKVGFGKFQIFALVFSGIGYFSDAMEVSLLSFIGPAVRSEWSLTHTQESLITTAVFVGMFSGAFFWGYVSDTYGRKVGIRFVSTIVFGAGLLSAFSPNYTLLLVLRVMVGFGISGSHVFISWFLEFIPISNRGVWMLVMSASWIFGELLEVSLAWIITPRFGWRCLLVVSSFPALTALLLSGFAPESPRYLFMKGRTQETCVILRKMASVNCKEIPAGNLILDHHQDAESSSEGSHLLSLQNGTKVLKTCLQTIRQLFSPNLLKTTLLLWTLDFFYTFIYYGIQLMISSLSSQNDCSVGNTLVGDNHDSLYTNTLITCVAELPGLIVATITVDWLGRKICMELISLFTVISIVPLIGLQSGPLASALLISARMFMSAAFNTLIVYAEEVYPTPVRATGTGLMSAVGRLGGMLCPLVAVGLVRECHLTLAATFFAVVVVLSGVCVLFFPFETKGRDLTDFVRKADDFD